jgi:hypothetical protein
MLYISDKNHIKLTSIDKMKKPPHLGGAGGFWGLVSIKNPDSPAIAVNHFASTNGTGSPASIAGLHVLRGNAGTSATELNRFSSGHPTPGCVRIGSSRDGVPAPSRSCFRGGRS